MTTHNLTQRSAAKKLTLSILFPTVVAVASAVSPVAHAGRYVLEKGKGAEVCEAYEKALNSGVEVSEPGHSRPMPKGAKHFGKPRWEDDIGIFEAPYLPKIWRYRFERDVNPVISFFGVDRWREWRSTKDQYAEALENYLTTLEKGQSRGQYLARFDIDNDGQVDTVYMNHSIRASLFVVLDNDQTDLNYDKTERAQAHPPRKAMGLGEFRPVTKDNKHDWGVTPTDVELGMTPVPDAASNATYDFFFYKGKTYYDLWWDNHPAYKGRPPWEVGRLQVFILEPGKSAREICTYRLNRASSH